MPLLMLVQFWWGFWQFSDVEGWSFRSLLAIVALGVTMVMAMLVITPPRERDVVRRLDEFYWAQAPLYFLLARSRAQSLHAAVLVTSYALFAVFIAVVYVRK